MKIQSTSQSIAVEGSAALTETTATDSAGQASEAPPSAAEARAYREYQAGVEAQAKNMVLAEMEMVADGGAVTRPGKALDAKASMAAFGEAMGVLRGGSPTWNPAAAGSPIGAYSVETTNRFEAIDKGMIRESGKVDNQGSLQGGITRDIVQNFGGMLAHQHQPSNGPGSLTVIHDNGKGPCYKIENLQTPADWQKAFEDVKRFEEAQPPVPQGI